MRITHTYSGRTYEAALDWPADLTQGPDVVIPGLGTADPFAFEVTAATAAEVAALPWYWRDLVRVDASQGAGG